MTTNENMVRIVALVKSIAVEDTGLDADDIYVHIQLQPGDGPDDAIELTITENESAFEVKYLANSLQELFETAREEIERL